MRQGQKTFSLRSSMPQLLPSFSLTPFKKTQNNNRVTSTLFNSLIQYNLHRNTRLQKNQLIKVKRQHWDTDTHTFTRAILNHSLLKSMDMTAALAAPPSSLLTTNSRPRQRINLGSISYIAASFLSFFKLIKSQEQTWMNGSVSGFLFSIRPIFTCGLSHTDWSESTRHYFCGSSRRIFTGATCPVKIFAVAENKLF